MTGNLPIPETKAPRHGCRWFHGCPPQAERRSLRSKLRCRNPPRTAPWMALFPRPATNGGRVEFANGKLRCRNPPRMADYGTRTKAPPYGPLTRHGNAQQKKLSGVSGGRAQPTHPGNKAPRTKGPPMDPYTARERTVENVIGGVGRKHTGGTSGGPRVFPADRTPYSVLPCVPGNLIRGHRGGENGLDKEPSIP
jgi:hypothetical protein